MNEGVAVAAFIGAFCATLVISVLAPGREWIKWFAAFLVGIVLTFCLAWLAHWVAHVFARAA